GHRDAHRPDPDGSRMAWSPGPGGNRRRANQPGGPGHPGFGRHRADRARPGRAGVDGHARLVLRRRPRNRRRTSRAWPSTHGWFFVGYAVGAALAFGLPALLLWGSGQERRRRRAQCWRVAGTVAAAVPLASYLANLAPWGDWAHPAWWLYGLTAGWTLVMAAAALAGPWRRDVPGPFGAICAATLLLLAVDVIAGSRLQLDAPFGLSLLVSGRFYGIGNDALGVYGVSALVAATWVASIVSRQTPQEPLPTHPVLWPCG